jgi:hypothetical protein
MMRVGVESTFGCRAPRVAYFLQLFEAVLAPEVGKPPARRRTATWTLAVVIDESFLAVLARTLPELHRLILGVDVRAFGAPQTVNLACYDVPGHRFALFW